MLVGTHALLPVCGCLAIDHACLLLGRDRLFPVRSLGWVAAFGVLPDLCSPHLSLEARYSSFSHTLWFLALLVPLAATATGFMKAGTRMRLAIACWCAAALHLAADAVSGGIAWLQPWRADIIGDYHIHPDHWIFYDISLLILFWLQVRVNPHLEAHAIRRAFARE